MLRKQKSTEKLFDKVFFFSLLFTDLLFLDRGFVVWIVTESK